MTAAGAVALSYVVNDCRTARLWNRLTHYTAGGLYRFLCDDTYNPDQEDYNGDDIGDACCCGHFTAGQTGNTTCSDDGKLTLSDITVLIDKVHISKAMLCCETSGNVNASTDEKITLSDITRLVDNIYISKEPTEPCL